MSQMSTSNSNSTSDAQPSQTESDTPTLNWEPKVVKVKGIRLWEVENDQDAMNFCKKQLRKVRVTYRFISADYRTFQKTSNSLARPTKAVGIHKFTGRKWSIHN